MNESKSGLSGAKIILGVTGSIAAYKSVVLLRELCKAGADVSPVMTENAVNFVSPLTFSSLAKKETVVAAFKPGGGFVRHVELAESADMLIIAPATANIIGKAASGIADDFLSTLYIACDCPVIMAPAMNHRMYAHFQVQANIARLRDGGVIFAGPDSGNLACGEGAGRMIEPENIAAIAADTLAGCGKLCGKTVLITLGPTREYIDPIRFISNDSSGKMGVSLAVEAQRRGARVIVVAGPGVSSFTPGAEVHHVVSASEMYHKTIALFPECDIAIMTAAVGDYSIETPYSEKLKKDPEGDTITLSLKKNKDILAELGRQRKEQTVIGFCLETNSLLEHARKKKKKKNCSIMVANLHDDDGAGIGSNLGKVTVITKEGKEVSLLAQKKTELAKHLWDIFIEDTWHN